MKRQSPAKSKKVKKSPVNKNPIVFEPAFEKKLGQTPIDYLISKVQGGSSVSSIEYLFDIVSAEIAIKNNCVCKGFAYYHSKAQERMNTMKKHTVHNKLVRDRIPEIIEASGRTCITEVLLWMRRWVKNWQNTSRVNPLRNLRICWKSWVLWLRLGAIHGMT